MVSQQNDSNRNLGMIERDMGAGLSRPQVLHFFGSFAMKIERKPQNAEQAFAICNQIVFANNYTLWLSNAAVVNGRVIGAEVIGKPQRVIRQGSRIKLIIWGMSVQVSFNVGRNTAELVIDTLSEAGYIDERGNVLV